MCDRDQEIFDNAEAASLHLHHLHGCLQSVWNLLDEPLAQAPDKGVRAYAILAAVEQFATLAEEKTARMAQLVSGAGAP